HGGPGCGPLQTVGHPRRGDRAQGDVTPVEIAFVIVVVAFALGVDVTNGFHDAANALATCGSTRALTPRPATTMRACFNLVGAMLGTGVAESIGSGIIEIDERSGHVSLIMVQSAVIGALTWNLITWWFGMPSSSSRVLIGALTGVGLAAGITVHWEVIF